MGTGQSIVCDAVITSTSADINAVIKALQLACANAVQQIEEYESTRTKAELAVAAKASPRGEVYRAEVAVDFYVTDRRRVAAACDWPISARQPRQRRPS